MLDKRHRRVRKAGKHVRSLDAEGLHELRKELKKLRYAVDMLGPLYPKEAVGPYLKALKELQDSFGSLNDAAMARGGADRAGRAGAGRPGGAARRRLGARHAGGAGRPTTGRGSSTAGTGCARRSRSGSEAGTGARFRYRST